MRIALDASLWDEPTTGIALYTRALARGLEDLGMEVLKVGRPRLEALGRGKLGRTAFTIGPLNHTLRAAAPDVFHAVANFNLPLVRPGGTRLVLTVHDVIPWTHPSTVSRGFRYQFWLWLTRSLKVADAVICVSEHTRGELERNFQVEREKVFVVPNGVDHVASVRAPAPLEQAYVDALALPERFVLYAGALDARKNVERVLDAVEVLSARGRPRTLVLMGQRWFGSGAIERRVVALRRRGHDIRVLGYQPAPVFYEVLRRAGVFVFPSLAEGFGLPPLEAMWLRVPVIVSAAGALPEVCGEAARRLGVDDPLGLAAAIDELASLEGEPLEALRSRGHRHARAFTWERTASSTRAVYEWVSRRGS